MVLALRYPLCFLLLLLLLLLPFSTTAQTYSNISLGSSLTAINNKNSSWPSESGEFAFGFQQVEGGFLLAIWFNKIPEKTIVWSANRNQLAPSGSKIQLTTDGRFVLDDPKGSQIWSADSAGARVSYAAMLDNGNFVLASNDSTNLWQSFDEPTDTILPTQTLYRGSKLVARFSEMNYSEGRFLFTLQADGNLVMYIIEDPTDSVPSNSSYRSSNTVGSGFQVIFNQSDYISLTADNRTILNQISNAASSREFYQRAILEYDGVFMQYVYPKDASSSTGKWPMAWTTSFLMPENIYMGIPVRAGTGGRACGFNSYCRLGDDQRPICQCPPGYSLLDPNSKMSGCKQDFVSQSCDEASQDTNRFDIQAMPNTDWPLSDYRHFQSVTEDWCRVACLDDCFCAVAIFRDGDCWKKRIPLSNGMTDPIVGGKALIKVRMANSTSQFEGGGPKNNDQSTSLGCVSELPPTLISSKQISVRPLKAERHKLHCCK